MTEEMLRFIDANWSADASISDDGMKDMVNEVFGTSLSRTTIMRCRNRLRFVYRPPKQIQLLTEEQKELRVIFCNWVLEHRSEVTNLLFTDESRFQKGPDNRWRRIKRGVINDACFMEREKFTKSVMVWGGIAEGYRTPLLRCSNGVDSDEYIQILEKSGFIEDLNAKHGQGNWMLLQDGAACHTSQKVVSFLERRRVCVVPGWPPNSPDLNPIEMLWGVMKRKLAGRWKNADDIFTLLTETWNDVRPETIDALVKSFIFRCELVLRLGGSSGTPYLSSHRSAPESPLAESSWTEDDDRTLRRHVQDHGTKWTRVGTLMGRSANFVKNRWACLCQKSRNRKHRDHQPLPPIFELDSDLESWTNLFDEWLK